LETQLPAAQVFAVQFDTVQFDAVQIDDVQFVVGVSSPLINDRFIIHQVEDAP